MHWASHSSGKPKGRRLRRDGERGVALATTLLLLLLLVGLSLAMTMSAGSDMFINNYYRNFRGSFYAADSGLNIVRQQMMVSIVAAVPPNFPPNVQPIPAGTEAAVLDAINKAYGANYLQLTNSGPAASSWPEKYKIDPTKTVLSFVSCVTDNGSLCTAPAANTTKYSYTYAYSLTAFGQSARGTEQAVLTDSGQLIFNATIIPASSDMSFAGYGMFINSFPICSGTLVPGTITGPVFTNDAWTFGNTGAYTFTGTVGSVSSQAGYNFGGTNNCDQVAGTSDTKNGKTIAPTFQAGFTMGAQPVPLPTDSYNQQRAVIDSVGTAGQPMPSDLNAVLKSAAGTAYPNSATPTPGVWLPYAPKVDPLTGKTVIDPVTGKAVQQFNGGGILVEGDASVVLSAVGTSQVYQINQGGVITTITVTPDPLGPPGSGTTIVSAAGTTTTIQGVPVQRDPANPAKITGDATMLYVDGNITSLSGTAEGAPAVQDGTQLTITGAKNITVTGDILYKSQPIKMPDDTLDPAGDTRQALGIYTANGDIQLNNKQTDNTLTIDASLATLRQGGSGGLINTGNHIDTLTIVGGRIQNNIKDINTSQRNVYFDVRFGSDLRPPWFPSTKINSGKNAAIMQPPIAQRTTWIDQTSRMP
jgi:Tfp pilus assembly protein PilX